MSLTRDRILEILKDGSKRQATEIHFKAPKPPQYRVGGTLMPIKGPGLTPEDTVDLIRNLAALAQREILFGQVLEETFSFGVSGLGRYRVSMYRQRGTIAAVIHPVPLSTPTLSDLGLDQRVSPVISRPGLVLVCGGQRRGQLLAALVTELNATMRGHIVFLEEPLTALHRDGMAAISHREVGNDVSSFECGIRLALRQEADVIAVSRVETAEVAHAVLSAAEEGRIVLACVNAPSVSEASWWITRLFTGEQRADTEIRLHRQLNAIIGVPEGRAPEMMVGQQRPQRRAPSPVENSPS